MRIESDHRLLVEVLREPSGEPLAQDRLDDLTHLVEETRYEAVHGGWLPDEPERLIARLEPIPVGPNTPSLAGVRVALRHDRRPGPPFVYEFPKEIAGTRGTELSAALITQGLLEEGDVYRVRLVALSLPRTAPHRSEGWDGEVIEAPYPVQRTALPDVGIGPEVLAAADRWRRVFVARAVLERAIAEAVGHHDQEVGTLLLGSLVEDDSLRVAGFETAWAVLGAVPK